MPLTAASSPAAPDPIDAVEPTRLAVQSVARAVLGADVTVSVSATSDRALGGIAFCAGRGVSAMEWTRVAADPHAALVALLESLDDHETTRRERADAVIAAAWRQAS